MTSRWRTTVCEPSSVSCVQLGDNAVAPHDMVKGVLYKQRIPTGYADKPDTLSNYTKFCKDCNTQGGSQNSTGSEGSTIGFGIYPTSCLGRYLESHSAQAHSLQTCQQVCALCTIYSATPTLQHVRYRPPPLHVAANAIIKKV